MILLSSFARADGGPPMITDDPNVVAANKWEINMAQLTMTGPGSWYTQSPYFDINYGIGDFLQLKYETGISSVTNTAIPYGGPFAIAGTRWRFLDKEDQGLAMSFYPQYAFYPSYYSRQKDVDPNETDLFLPIEISQKWGAYTFNPEVGYNFVHGDEDSWAVGLLLSREMSKSWSTMAELHWQIPIDGHDVQTIFNVGTAYDLNETFSLLGSIGTSVDMSSSFIISYIGLQLHL